jgi:hypothetical protein
MGINKTYWSSGLLAINSDYIAEFDGTIVRTIFEDKDIPALLVTIKRKSDFLEKTIGFCYNPDFMDGLEKEETPSKEELLKAANEIYQGFDVSGYSELVGEQVIGVYYQIKELFSMKKSRTKSPDITDHLIGMRKIE